MTDVETVLYVGADGPDTPSAHLDSARLDSGRSDSGRSDSGRSDSGQFDETTHTWTVGDRRARVIIATDGALPTGPAQLDRADGLDPYLGVAVHGVPNYFLLTGPDTAAHKGYIAKCLGYLSRTGSTRIEVRSSAQQYFNEHSSGRTHRSSHYWRRVGKRIPSAFEVSSLEDETDTGDAVYDGPATVSIDDQSHHTRVRLTGHLDPIDGYYHWQGTVFDADFHVRPPQDVIITMGERTAAARLTERTPRSTYSVVGVGAPPFELGRIEVEVPLL